MAPKLPELPSARVEREIRSRIVTGEYPAGSQLPPMDELASEFGVSRGTVAAVLRKLPEVNVIPGYGSFVADLEGLAELTPDKQKESPGPIKGPGDSRLSWS